MVQRLAGQLRGRLAHGHQVIPRELAVELLRVSSYRLLARDLQSLEQKRSIGQKRILNCQKKTETNLRFVCQSLHGFEIVRILNLQDEGVSIGDSRFRDPSSGSCKRRRHSGSFVCQQGARRVSIDEGSLVGRE